MTDLELRNFAKALAGMITTEEAERAKAVPELSEAIKGIDLSNPEYYNLLVSFQLEQAQNSVLMEAFGNAKNPRSLAWLYQHYDYMNNKLSKYIGVHTGGACCVDRSRHILRLYKKYLETGDVPALGNRKDYWVPPFGSAQQWIDFCVAAENSYYSNPHPKFAQAIEAMNKEADAYVKRQEEKEKAYLETLHNSNIDFAKLMDLTIPVRLNDMEEGRMFCELLDVYQGNENHENLHKFYVESPLEDIVVTVDGRGIQFIDMKTWKGWTPVSFQSILQKKGV